MIDHDEIRSLLSAYCGGDLDPVRTAAVERHLAECADCRAEVADLQTLLRLLHSTPPVEAPPWLSSRIMARVREQQAARQGWLHRLFFPLQVKLPLEALALLVVCLTGWYLTRTVETELRRPVPRTDTLEQALPAQPPAAQPGAPHPIPPVGRKTPAEEAPAAKDSTPPRGQLDHAVPAPIQPTAPAAAPTISAPLTAPAAQPAPQLNLAPAPGYRVQRSAPPPIKAEQPLPLPKAETADRAREAILERKAKSSRMERRSDAAAPAAGRAAAAPPLQPLQQVVIHLKPRDPERAGAAIREAALRSGGIVVDEGALPARRMRLRIPAAQFDAFLIRLTTIGQLPEQPPAGGDSGMREVTIQW